MILKEVVEKCSKLGVDEQRCVSDEYVELVFFNKEIEQWNGMLTDALGPAVKPAGTQPTEGDLHLTKDYGGIHDNQTLFKKDFGDAIAIAMLWPWQDETHTTLKIALLKK